VAEERSAGSGLTLQLREKPHGGALLSAVLICPSGSDASRREMIVLIHGFNNDADEADASYQGFRQQQRQLGEDRLLQLDALRADMFWPGDADWKALDGLDFLGYPLAVTTAREAGARLASYFAAMSHLQSVHFLGHSLGCRVVLETIEALQAAGGPSIGRVCLMAAAVPTFMVEPDGRLAKGLRACERVLILYSDADKVLRFAFPAGQSVADGHEGFLPRALGYHRPRPGLPGRVDSIEAAGADHGDYWGHKVRAPVTQFIARQVAEFFNFGASVREVEARLPGSEVEVASRPGTEQARAAGTERSIGL
jgi:pimeloyl-ACP methyl ester carboxylesterase